MSLKMLCALTALILSAMVSNPRAAFGDTQDDVNVVVRYVHQSGQECARFNVAATPFNIPIDVCVRDGRFTFTAFATVAFVETKTAYHCAVAFADKITLGSFAFAAECPAGLPNRYVTSEDAADLFAYTLGHLRRWAEQETRRRFFVEGVPT